MLQYLSASLPHSLTYIGFRIILSHAFCLRVRTITVTLPHFLTVSMLQYLSASLPHSLNFIGFRVILSQALNLSAKAITVTFPHGIKALISKALE